MATREEFQSKQVSYKHKNISKTGTALEWYQQLDSSAQLISGSYQKSHTTCFIYNPNQKIDEQKSFSCIKITSPCKIQFNGLDVENYDVYIKFYSVVTEWENNETSGPRLVYATIGDCMRGHPYQHPSAILLDSSGIGTFPVGDYGFRGWEIVYINKTKQNLQELYKMPTAQGTYLISGPVASMRDKVLTTIDTNTEWSNISDLNNNHQLKVKTFANYYVQNKSFSRLADVTLNNNLSYRATDDVKGNFGKTQSNWALVFNGMDENNILNDIYVDRPNNTLSISFINNGKFITKKYPIDESTKIYIVERKPATFENNSIGPYVVQNDFIIAIDETEAQWQLGDNAAATMTMGGCATQNQKTKPENWISNINVKFSSPTLKQLELVNNGSYSPSELSFTQSITSTLNQYFDYSQYEEKIYVAPYGDPGDDNDQKNGICYSVPTDLLTSRVMLLANWQSYGGFRWKVSNICVNITYKIPHIRLTNAYKFFTKNESYVTFDITPHQNTVENYHENSLEITKKTSNLPGGLPTYINLFTKIINDPQGQRPPGTTWTGASYSTDVYKCYTNIGAYDVDIYHFYKEQFWWMTDYHYNGIRFGFNADQCKNGYAIFVQYI